MESGVTLITVTGVRPEAFTLCKEYVYRQTYSGPLQWIVVDDGDLPMPLNPEIYEQRGMKVTQIFPRPSWRPGQNTMGRNLLAAFPAVMYDKIFFIEDDDWYAADYVEHQLACMGDAPLVGETNAIYYNVQHQLYAKYTNTAHASLCQTGIRGSILSTFQRICEGSTASYSFDMQLWNLLRVQGVLHESHHCIGMKALPGRTGAGNGHRALAYVGWNYDTEWRFLKSVIGDDYLHYKALSTKDKEGDFEIFYWSGQKRYRCNQTWEGGAQCLFDTYDYRALLEHVSQPHTRSRTRPAPVSVPKTVSPIVGPRGEEIVYGGDD